MSADAAVIVGILGAATRRQAEWAGRLAGPNVKLLLVDEHRRSMVALIAQRHRAARVATARELLAAGPDGIVVTPLASGAVDLAVAGAERGCHVLVDEPELLSQEDARRLLVAAEHGRVAIRWAWDEALALGPIPAYLRGSRDRSGIGELTSLELDWRWRDVLAGAPAHLLSRAFAALHEIYRLDRITLMRAGSTGQVRIVVLHSRHLPPRVVIRSAADDALRASQQLRLTAIGSLGSLTAVIPTTSAQQVAQPEVALTHASGPPRLDLLEGLRTFEQVRTLNAVAWLDHLRGRTRSVGVVGRDGLRPLVLRDAAAESARTGEGVVPPNG